MSSRAPPVPADPFAGAQSVTTRPIRMEDAVVIEGEFDNVEESASTYVVVRLCKLRQSESDLKIRDRDDEHLAITNILRRGLIKIFVK